MAERPPWLTIIGLGEDGLDGLGKASRLVIAQADVVFGAPRHLELAGAQERGRAWPVPFDIAPLLALRGQGRQVVALASGDPFWFGAGSVLAEALNPEEWRAYPAPSTFSLAAARLGWPLERVLCLGLHKHPLTHLRAHLSPGMRAICLLSGARSVKELADYLCAAGFGGARLWVFERLGGPAERVRTGDAHRFCADLELCAPVAAAFCLPKAGPEAADDGAGLPVLAAAPGRPEAAFHHDGQISKWPARAITLAALAPRFDALLWDLGAGSGAISVEWALAGGRAYAVERLASRAKNIARNIHDFGLAGRVELVQSAAQKALASLPFPDAIFVGGGADEPLFDALLARLGPREGRAPVRLVANAVTLETEALFHRLQLAHGGELMRFDWAEAAPLGAKRAWRAGARTLVQWSALL